MCQISLMSIVERDSEKANHNKSVPTSLVHTVVSNIVNVHCRARLRVERDCEKANHNPDFVTPTKEGVVSNIVNVHCRARLRVERDCEKESQNLDSRTGGPVLRRNDKFCVKDCPLSNATASRTRLRESKTSENSPLGTVRRSGVGSDRRCGAKNAYRQLRAWRALLRQPLLSKTTLKLTRRGVNNRCKAHFPGSLPCLLASRRCRGCKFPFGLF